MDALSFCLVPPNAIYTFRDNLMEIILGRVSCLSVQQFGQGAAQWLSYPHCYFSTATSVHGYYKSQLVLWLDGW